MTDLLDDEAVDDFRSAMRDVADTFNRYPVILQQAGGDLSLKAAKASLGSSTKGFEQTDEGAEIEDGYLLKFNRKYLAEQGLIDGNDSLLIDYDDRVLVDGKRYGISAIDSVGTFRDADLNVVLKVVR